jgi:hypothetical protein
MLLAHRPISMPSQHSHLPRSPIRSHLVGRSPTCRRVGAACGPRPDTAHATRRPLSSRWPLPSLPSEWHPGNTQAPLFLSHSHLVGQNPATSRCPAPPPITPCLLDGLPLDSSGTFEAPPYVHPPPCSLFPACSSAFLASTTLVFFSSLLLAAALLHAQPSPAARLANCSCSGAWGVARALICAVVAGGCRLAGSGAPLGGGQRAQGRCPDHRRQLLHGSGRKLVTSTPQWPHLRLYAVRPAVDKPAGAAWQGGRIGEGPHRSLKLARAA